MIWKEFLMVHLNSTSATFNLRDWNHKAVLSEQEFLVCTCCTFFSTVCKPLMSPLEILPNPGSRTLELLGCCVVAVMTFVSGSDGMLSTVGTSGYDWFRYFHQSLFVCLNKSHVGQHNRPYSYFVGLWFLVWKDVEYDQEWQAIYDKLETVLIQNLT